MSPPPPSASAPAADPAEVTAAAPASPRAGAAGGSGSRAADDVARLISRLQAAIASVPPSPPLPEEQIRPEQAQGSRGSTSPAETDAGTSGRPQQPLDRRSVRSGPLAASSSSPSAVGSPPPVSADLGPPPPPPPTPQDPAASPAGDRVEPPAADAGASPRGRHSRPPSGSFSAGPAPQRPQRSTRRPGPTAKASPPPSAVHPGDAPGPAESPAAAAEGGAARVPLPPKPSSPADADAPDGGEAGASGDADQLLQRITELERRLRDKTEEVESLTCDLDAVSKKCVEHVGKLAEVQHSKDEAENELEDLSRQLFETANGMVADAARARHQLEGAHRALQAKFDETQEALSNERSQLRELKRRMEEMSAEHGEDRGGSGFQSRRGSQDIIHRRSLSDLTGLRDRKVPAAQGANEDGLSADIPRIPPPDEAVIQEFEMFVRLLPDTPLRRLHSLPFLRHCLEEEVDCCLRFMPTSRLTTRRLVDAIVNNTCSIEDAPTSTPATPSQLGSPAGSLPSSPQPIRAARQTSQLWERFTQGLQPLEPGDCYTCGRPGPCAFRFRMADDEPWAPIDGFCRDRVVAACEFYVFIRNLRLGLYGSRSEQDLYTECTRLRLQMFYAKIGALPWSELDRRVPEKPAWADAAPDAKPQQRAAAPPARDLAWAERPPLSPVSDNIQSNGNPNIVINPTSVA